MFSTFSSVFRNRFVSLAILFFLTVLVYLPSSQLGFVLDDQLFILDWPLIQTISNLPRFFYNFIPPLGYPDLYSPLRTLIYSIDFQLFGYNPGGYHFSALITHFCGVLGVYLLANLLTGRRGLAFGAGLVFVLHPVQVESISYKSAAIGAKGLVCMFYAVYFYLKAAKTGVHPLLSGEKKSNPGVLNKRFYLLALFFAFAANWINEQTLILPLLLLHCESCCFGITARFRQVIKRVAPFLIIVLSYAAAKIASLGYWSVTPYLEGQPYLSMMAGIKAIAKGIGLLIFPMHLSIDQIISPGIYSLNPLDFDNYAVLSQNLLEPFTLLSLGVIAGLIFLSIRADRRQPLIKFSLGWILLTLLPLSNVIPQPRLFSETFLYVSVPGLAWLVALVFMRLFAAAAKVSEERANPIINQSNLKMVALIIVAGLTLSYGWRTILRQQDWRSDVNILRAAVNVNPLNPGLQNLLATAYRDAGQPQEAIEHHQRAISLRPDDPFYHFAFENVLSEQGRYDEARRELLRAVELKPDYAEAYYNLAGMEAYLGREKVSQDYLNRSVQAYVQQGRLVEAGEAAETMTDYIKSRRENSTP